MAHPNLIDKLEQALSAAARCALDALLRSAQEERFALYLVGGSLRDLLLERPTLDVDLTVEGDAPTLARRAAAHLPDDVRCTVHSAFRTATLKGGDFRLDVATARAEVYERPGALPSVRPGSLRDDLFRRDFAVNAMALALTGPDADGDPRSARSGPPSGGDRLGSIVDPFGGRADLGAKLLRVLHEGSFRDDATRILRGARYESRLGFRLEAQTMRWLRRDVSFLKTISGPRLREELARTLREPQPERILLRLDQVGALRAIHPALAFDRRRAAAFARLRQVRRDPSTTACLALLAWELPREQAAALADRLALARREGEAVGAAPLARELQRELSRQVKPSRAVELLSSLPPASVWALAASAPGPAGQQALRYLRRWRYVKPRLDGHDLLAMGAQPGPRLGDVLRRLKAARLDGEVRSRRDEERMARDLLGLGAGIRG